MYTLDFPLFNFIKVYLCITILTKLHKYRHKGKRKDASLVKLRYIHLYMICVLCIYTYMSWYLLDQK